MHEPSYTQDISFYYFIVNIWDNQIYIGIAGICSAQYTTTRTYD